MDVQSLQNVAQSLVVPNTTVPLYKAAVLMDKGPRTRFKTAEVMKLETGAVRMQLV